MILMWILFALFFVVYVLKMFPLWLVLSVWSIGLSIFLLIKNKLPSMKYIIISVILAFVAGISYLGYFYKFNFQMLLTGIPCLLACLAVFSVMEKCGGYQLIKTDKKLSLLISILIALGLGIILGLINLMLGKNYMTTDLAISFSRILVSLNPGIHEEITYRAIFMAFFIFLFSQKNKEPSKFQIFTMWFMMSVPHCLSHGYPLIQSLILLVLFSLPFTLLQRKRDLTSAMISHSLIDLIRFIVFGMPM